ncbi:MAG: MarR family transcriptional regulator [Sphingomonas sp.]|nr:MarR family transcriptional regulator [Sphingomonas sp.]
MKQVTDLDGLLGYQLQRSHMLVVDDAREALKIHDITPAKLTALLLIRASPGCDQTALGRALETNRSSAMKLVNFLVDRGLVERRPGRDLRTNALHLLPGVEDRIQEMLKALSESDARMSERLTSEERARLLSLLRKLGPAKNKRLKRRANE